LNRPEQALAQWEGESNPSDQNWDGKTVSIGFDMSTNPRAEELRGRISKELGVESASNAEVGQYFIDNPEESQNLLKEELRLHTEELKAAWPAYEQLDDVRQEAMSNLEFNMGNVTSKFPSMAKALEEEDFDEAAKQLLTTSSGKAASKFLKDVGPRRAGAMAFMLLTGKYPSQEEMEAAAKFIEEESGLI
jgi:GH24 family phage-related lysozyme (muramidase)